MAKRTPKEAAPASLPPAAEADDAETTSDFFHNAAPVAGAASSDTETEIDPEADAALAKADSLPSVPKTNGNATVPPELAGSTKTLAVKGTVTANSENAVELAAPKQSPTGVERRKKNIPVAVDRRRNAAAKRNPDRRRQVDPTTCERDYSNEEIEFMRAMDEYKRTFGRPFPTWSEVLEVLKSMGYRRVAQPTSIELNRNKSKTDNTESA